MNTDNQSRIIEITCWIFSIAAMVLFIQALADALPKHAIDTAWPAHSKFHVVTGAAFQAACSLMVILIARIPFRQRQKWSWYALAIYTLGFAVHIPAAMWQGSGPPVGAWYLIGGLLLLMSVSLILSWRTFHRR